MLPDQLLHLPQRNLAPIDVAFVRHSSFEKLPHLVAFARAAELGSFTAAALKLGISQAAVSQRIALLERRLGLGLLLFDRRSGRGRLTEAGDCLLEYAAKILALHAEAVPALDRRAGL